MYTVNGVLGKLYVVYIYVLVMHQQNITWEMLNGVLLIDAIIFLPLPKPFLLCFDDNVALTTVLTINGQPRLH